MRKSRKYCKNSLNWLISTEKWLYFTEGSRQRTLKTFIKSRDWKFYDSLTITTSRKATCSGPMCCWCSCDSKRRRQSRCPLERTKFNTMQKEYSENDCCIDRLVIIITIVDLICETALSLAPARLLFWSSVHWDGSAALLMPISKETLILRLSCFEGSSVLDSSPLVSHPLISI